MKIRIATRTSPLALLQTNQVISLIESAEPSSVCEIIPIESEGDLTEAPLHLIGGKGLFVSKLEAALSNGDADIAVHSLKDVPAILDPKFSIAATLSREDPSDAILLKDGITFNDLGKNSRIGTSGPRRKSQMLAMHPDLDIIPVRGNIQTRINKIVSENLDGLIVAKAALNRLKIHYPNMHIFSEKQMLPAAAQGAIGIEVHVSQIQSGILEMLNMINCQKTFTATKIERDIVAALEGSCLSPISALVTAQDSRLHLQVRVSNQDGSIIIEKEITFLPAQELETVSQFKIELLAEGAQELIQT
ncbi:hydroxymethylbilane synthase [Gammaproteobacteria bacterium]|nr:hydroxymethylbilane synthase [Gammaproteobacteria bacterium]MDA9249056.1 hydroxymethylbilane synthase [Gammaproteobacteria bacterium]MDA9259899.1 hydroxymethylbilane synthase [Gammaproteobacteria bacterium]MDA9269172.1 hydroxymethylbilane synthase [Gammaproteobacteria bacterium]MDB0070371.1 hydroxymethylbilane synthase [Gammaproteobacteria bacterium]